LAYQKKISDTIDFGVIKGIINTYFSIKTSLELSSDHSSIIINVNNKEDDQEDGILRATQQKNKLGVFSRTSGKYTKHTNIF